MQVDCKHGADCFRPDCKYRHPIGHGVCQDGTNCKFSDCRAPHPPRPKCCKHAMGCNRAKAVCEYLHPRAWYEECQTMTFDPEEILFTHDKKTYFLFKLADHVQTPSDPSFTLSPADPDWRDQVD